MWPLSWIWWISSPHRHGGTDFSRPAGLVRVERSGGMATGLTPPRSAGVLLDTQLLNIGFSHPLTGG